MESPTQKIFLNENHFNVYSSIHASSVDIIPSSESAISNLNKKSSSCLLVSPIVSYEWEYKYYPSKILAKHMPSGNIAWVIKSNQSQLLVRLTNGNRVRSLLKNFDGDSLTLDFSPYHEPILAILSFDGVLKIFHTNYVQDENKLLLSINLNLSGHMLTSCSLKWGSKSTLPEANMDTSLLLAAAVNQSVYLIDLNGVVEHLGENTQSVVEAAAGYHSQPRLLNNMIQKLASYSSNVEAMEFSSNSSTFFVSANLGRIFMFNLSDIKSGSLSAFREWSTGSLSPLFALYSIDFRSNGNTSGYLIGGTNFNRELRIWRLPDCELIQTVRLCANEDHDAKETMVEVQKPSLQPMLITQFDSNSGLLLASDIKRTVLYAFLLARHSDPPHELRFQCVCEFLLVSPCIAFDLSSVVRSQPFKQLFSESRSTESDNIHIELVLIHPKELKIGKLTFFVPLEIYKQTNLIPPKVPLPIASGACSSPLIPEGDKSTGALDMFSRFLSRRPNSATEGRGDRPPSPLPTENPPSVGSTTPQVSPENELPQTLVEVEEKANTHREEGSVLKKVFDSAPGNIDSSLLSVQRNDSTLALEASSSIVNPSRIPYLSFEGSDKQPVFSDSVRSLVGGSTIASLSNSLYRDSSNADLPGPPNDALTKAMGLSMNNVLSDSARSLDGNSTDADLTHFHPDSPKLPVQQVLGSTGFSLDGLSGISDITEVARLLKIILQQNKEMLSSIKTLTNKVQENRNSLSKLSNVQNTILKQVNALNMAPGTVVGPVASSPPWANQILDQVRKQKAESAKQLAHLEEAVRSLQLSTGVSSGLITTRSPESPTIGPENRQLADQIRGVIRNTPKIVDPLIKNLRGNLERLLSPLPQSVADRMLTIIKEPKFLNYLGDHMSSSLSPAVTEGYRKELRQTLVPGLNKVVEKLCKDLNDLVQGALNQHIQAVTLRLESGVQNNCNKMDASTKKFDEQINRLSKDISAKLTSRVNELLTKALQQQQTQQHQSEPQISSAGVNSFAGTAPSQSTGGGQKELLTRILTASSTPAPASNPFVPLTPTLKQQQLKNITIGSADTYSTALNFIHSRQYAQALETALTSPDQTMLLQVLQNIPIVPLFAQNIRQEILLSLLHQLSCGNLQEQFEMKISFLQEALNHLRVNDPTIREMGDRILSSLFNKISILRSSAKLNVAEENRAITLQRTLIEKRTDLYPLLT